VKKKKKYDFWKKLISFFIDIISLTMSETKNSGSNMDNYDPSEVMNDLPSREKREYVNAMLKILREIPPGDVLYEDAKKSSKEWLEILKYC
jgi:hypothetical protein